MTVKRVFFSSVSCSSKVFLLGKKDFHSLNNIFTLCVSQDGFLGDHKANHEEIQFNLLFEHSLRSNHAHLHLCSSFYEKHLNVV